MAEEMNRCVIISGAPGASAEELCSCVKPDDYIICADSGYALAQKAGIIPDLFVGDCDSFTAEIGENIPVVRLQTHKDDTDTHHCAKLAVEKGFKKVVIFGAIGGRLDHTYANLSVMCYFFENGVECVLQNAAETVYYVKDGCIEFNGMNGITFSVFPFACEQVIMSINGDTEYPAEGLTVASNDTVGLSNIFRCDDVKIRISGSAIVITERKI